MIETKLPDTAKWTRQLKILVRGMGLTQAQVAKAAGMSIPTYTKTLKNEGPVENLKAIEDGLISIEESQNES